MPPTTTHAPTLSLLAEKTLSYTISLGLLAYEPRTDLIAVVTDQGDIDIYRSGGQRACTFKRSASDGAVTCLRWITEGRHLVIGSDSGIVDRFDPQSQRHARLVDNKEGRRESVLSHSSAPITCLGYCTCNDDLNRRSKRSPASRDLPAEVASGSRRLNESTTDWFEHVKEHGDSDPLRTLQGNYSDHAATDMPQRLAMSGIDDAVPRLSVIPAPAQTRTKQNAFTSPAGVDALITQWKHSNTGSTGLVIVGDSNGKVRARFNLIFGKVYDGLSLKKPGGEPNLPIRHCGNPASSFHAVLRGSSLRDRSRNSSEVANTINPRNVYENLNLDFCQIPHSLLGSPHSSLIMGTIGQLESLNAYLMLSVNHLVSDWRTHTTLPSRFMESINETLSEKGEGDLAQNLCHLAMTGHCSDTMTEWLRDELAERGHKRWDQAMLSLYSSIGQFLRVNILPALERCTIATTSLRGLARYYEGSKKFEVDPAVFTDILRGISRVQILVHESVQIAGREERQFQAFSKWLRHQIDLAAAEPGSTSALEMAEREAMSLDFAKILAYIEGPLTRSKLENILSVDEGQVTNKNDQEPDLAQLMEALKADVKSDKTCALTYWAGLFDRKCKAAMAAVRKWQDSTWSAPTNIFLHDDPVSDMIDMRMVFTGAEVMTVLLLSIPDSDPQHLNLHSVQVHGMEGTKSVTKIHKALHKICLEEAAEILDVGFIDDTALLILVRSNESSRLIRIAYDISEPFPAEELQDLSATGSMDRHTIHVFPKHSQFVPARMVISVSGGKQNVCVLADSGRQWRILDLHPARGGSEFRKAMMEDESDDDEEEDDSMMVD